MSKGILDGLLQGNPYCDPYLNQYGHRDRAYEEAQMRAIMQQHDVSNQIAAARQREPQDNPILLLLAP